MIRDERGQYSVMTLLLLAGMVMLLGMITDIGRAYAVRRMLQNSVDTAAQSAAHQINPNFSGRETQLHIGAAMGTAYEYFYRNAPAGVTIESLVVSVDPTTSTVEVRAQVRVPCMFLRLAGVREIRPIAVGRATVVYGLNREGE
jgi:Flp pilus assembly protein TadG